MSITGSWGIIDVYALKRRSQASDHVMSSVCSDAFRHHLQHFLTHLHSFTIDTNGQVSPLLSWPKFSGRRHVDFPHTVGRRCNKHTPLNSRCSTLRTLHTTSRSVDSVSVGKAVTVHGTNQAPFVRLLVSFSFWIVHSLFRINPFYSFSPSTSPRLAHPCRPRAHCCALNYILAGFLCFGHRSPCHRRPTTLSACAPRFHAPRLLKLLVAHLPIPLA